MRCCNCTRAREHHRLRSARFLRRVVKSRYAAGKRKQVSQTLRSDNLSPVTLKHPQPIHARPQSRSNTLSTATLKHPQPSHAQTPSGQPRSNTLSTGTLKHPQPSHAQTPSAGVSPATVKTTSTQSGYLLPLVYFLDHANALGVCSSYFNESVRHCRQLPFFQNHKVRLTNSTHTRPTIGSMCALDLFHEFPHPVARWPPQPARPACSLCVSIDARRRVDTAGVECPAIKRHPSHSLMARVKKL